MNTIQYIGARYVPKFFEGTNGSEWEPNISYEPLTIVTWLGSSWTSKKVVPPNIGSPNLNLEYWVNTGNLNQQIEEFMRELSDLQTETDTLSTELNNIDTSVNYMKKNNDTRPATSVLPLYRGDFVTYGFFNSCVVKANNFIYAFNPCSRNDSKLRSNTGNVKKYNFSTGELISDTEIPIGHAQSCCYNITDGFIYLVPMIDYSGVSDVRDQHLYKINPTDSPSIAASIDTGFNIRNITYDPVSNAMYAMDDYMNIYSVSNSYEFTLVLSLMNAFKLPEIIQDFAIYNNVVYLTSTLNRCAKFIWDGISTSANPDEIFEFACTDSLDFWKIGEIEGIEFDADGHLFCSTFSAISPSDIIDGIGYILYNNIICELPIGTRAPYPLRGNRVTPGNRTFQINQTYTNLYLDSNVKLRDYYQIMALAHEYHSVYLTADYTTGKNGQADLHIHKHMTIALNNKKIKLHRLEIAADTTLVDSGSLEFTKDSSTNGMIYFTRGNLSLANNLNIELACSGETSRDNNFINPGNKGSEIWDGASITSDLTLYVGSHERVQYSLYRGNKVIT